MDTTTCLTMGQRTLYESLLASVSTTLSELASAIDTHAVDVLGYVIGGEGDDRWEETEGNVDSIRANSKNLTSKLTSKFRKMGFEGVPSSVSNSFSETQRIKDAITDGTFTWSMVTGNSSLHYMPSAQAPSNTNNLFSACTSLEAIPSFAVKNSGNNMFQGCSSLIYIESLTCGSDVTSMFSMFHDCSSLKTVDVSDWDVSGVTSMYNLFYGCSVLNNIDVSQWSNSSVTNVGYAFYNCSSLEELIFGASFDTSSVTSFVHMFEGCIGLRKIDISHFSASSSTACNGMFLNCSSLVNIIGDAGEGNFSDVVSSGVTALSGLKVDISLTESPLNAASVWALLNGLAADIQETHTVAFKSGLFSGYTQEEQSAITAVAEEAAANGWTITNMQ